MGLYRILVVDDEEADTLPVAAALEGAGYGVAVARDGWDGLAQARRTPPDLILLDVKMPQMDGWTFMRFIRAHPDLAAIPVVYLTGAASEADRRRGWELGAAGYLAKPMDPEQLLEEVAAVLDRRGGMRIPDGEIRHEPGLSRLRMSGRMDQLGLPSLLSILGAGERTGALEFQRGPFGDRGRILLRKGRVASARVEGLRRATGLDAVEVLGRWKDGAFTFVEEEMLVAEDATASVPRI